jgi:hypothetical protein
MARSGCVSLASLSTSQLQVPTRHQLP